MNDYEYEKLTGKMAFSKAGHDRGRLYVIIGEDREYIYLSDGRLRLKNNPKKKKRRHIQPVKNLPAEAQALLADIQTADDAAVRKAIRLVRKEKEKEENACQKQM